MLQALCPLCNQGLLIPPEMAGQAMRCPHCGGAFQAPSAAAIEHVSQSTFTAPAADPRAAYGNLPAQQDAPPTFQPAASTSAETVSAPVTTKSTAPTKAKPNGAWEVTKIVGGGLLGLAIGWVVVVKVIFPLQQRSPQPAAVAKRSVSKPATTHPYQPAPSPKQEQPISPGIPNANLPSPANQERAPSTVPPAQLPPAQNPQTQPFPTSGFPSQPPASATQSPSTPTPPQPSSNSPSTKPNESASQTNPSPPQPTSGNPFERLSPVLKLPSPVATAAQTVATFSCPLAEPLEIQIDSNLANVGEGAAFVTTKADNAEAVWQVHYIADTRTDNSERRKLGQFEVSNRELRYLWDQVSEETPWKQLANCQVTLASGNHRHTAQLREPKKEGAVELDLDKAKDIRKVAVGALPKAQRLQLSIEQLVNFPAGAQIKGDKRVIAPGQEAAIEFASLPGAAVEIKFAKQPDDSLAVMVSPVFKEKGSADIPLTNKRLQDMAEATDKWLREASSAIPALEQEFLSLQSQVQSAKARADSAQGGAAVEAGRALGALTTKLDACGRKLKRLKLQAPEMQARQAAVPKVKTLIDSLHGKARIELKLIASGPEGAALALADLAGQ